MLVDVPVKIGDPVWAVKNRKGVLTAERGYVGDIHFSRDMRLIIVVKYVTRGCWGDRIFATEEEAEAKIQEIKDLEELGMW